MPDYTFPVLFEGATITSGIGPRNAPIAGASTNHRGIDIAAPIGAPVVAPTDLQITYAGVARGYGNVIYGTDGSGNQYRFAHLDGFNVQAGQTVGAGQQIGAVGNTGNSSGPHLHFEVRDAAGNLLSDATRRVVSAARSQAGEALNSILLSNPVTAPFAIGANALGVNPLGDGDGCGINPICHLRKWLEETSFVERGALYIVGAIFIIGAIVFLAKGYTVDTIGKAAKGALA